LSTLANTETATPAVYKEAVIEPFSGEVVSFEGRPDAEIVAVLGDFIAAKREWLDRVAGYESGLKAILEQRMRERGATGIPHPEYEIALVEEFAPYMFYLDALREAAKDLPDDEKGKFVKHVPEQVAVIPAHDEPGPAVSIRGICKRYGWDESRFMARASLGTKFKFKPRSSAPKPVEQIEESKSA